MEKEVYNRDFKLWFYQVSHREAIFRSPKGNLEKAYDTNIDIYLGDIIYMEIPTSIQELHICNATVKDVDYLSQKLGEAISVEKIIIFVSRGKKYYVVASIIKILENDLDFGVLPIYTCLKGQIE